MVPYVRFSLGGRSSRGRSPYIARPTTSVATSMTAATPGVPRNPYAPPRADVADVPVAADAAPALWNPNAAANWSLVFSPAFGAFLHMRNWEALGESGKARTSRLFVAGTLALWLVTLCLAMFSTQTALVDALYRVMGFGLLLGWYFSLGRSQAKFVQARYGKTYPRRGWLKPLSLGVTAVLGFFVCAFVLALIAGAVGA